MHISSHTLLDYMESYVLHNHWVGIIWEDDTMGLLARYLALCGLLAGNIIHTWWAISREYHTYMVGYYKEISHTHGGLLAGNITHTWWAIIREYHTHMVGY